MAKKSAQIQSDIKVVCRNRRARHNYHIESTMEAGLVLKGTEVKSLRLGRADLADSYGTIENGEIYLVSMHIAAYEKAGHFNHEPRRPRKLLLNKRVIHRLGIKIRERGYTLVPLELYFKKGWAKILMGVAKGRKLHDNRDTIRRDEERREMRDAARQRKQ